MLESIIERGAIGAQNCFKNSEMEKYLVDNFHKDEKQHATTVERVAIG